MDHRERVMAAMRHEEPDRVPFFYRDVPEVEERLRRDLGLADREALLRAFDIDFRWVAPHYVGPPLEDAAAGLRRDIYGVKSRYVHSETGGYWEPVAFPLAGVEDAAALDDHPWPRIEWFDFSGLEAQCRAFAGYALMTAPAYASPSPLGVVQNLLGIERAMMDMALRPEFLEALFDRVVSFQAEYVERMLSAAGGRIDFFRIGDDFGTQRALLFSEAHWRRFLRPVLVRLSTIARRHGAFYYHHSCGAIRPLIPALIEAGVDVLDPVQVKAHGMAPGGLKAQFGGRLVFSGGVDEQELLPRGTPDDVRRGVRDLLDVMAPGGGFFIGPTHNFQSDIPTANIVAMYDAARRWRR
jgi:uroporphyrinogen decarboxylase